MVKSEFLNSKLETNLNSNVPILSHLEVVFFICANSSISIWNLDGKILDFVSDFGFRILNLILSIPHSPLPTPDTKVVADFPQSPLKYN